MEMDAIGSYSLRANAELGAEPDGKRVLLPPQGQRQRKGEGRVNAYWDPEILEDWIPQGPTGEDALTMLLPGPA